MINPQPVHPDGDDYIPSEENTLHRQVSLHTQPQVSGNVASELRDGTYTRIVQESVTRASGFEQQTLPITTSTLQTGAPIQTSSMIEGTTTYPSGIAYNPASNVAYNPIPGDTNLVGKIREDAVKHLPAQSLGFVSGTPGTETVTYSAEPIQTITPTQVYQQGPIDNISNIPLAHSAYPTVQGVPADIERRFAAVEISEVHPVTTTVITQTPIIQPVTTTLVQEEFMKNSTSINRTQDVMASQSTWEHQQADLASMRYENHNTFEAWEKNRNLFVTDRLTIIDNLLAGMDRQLAWLDAGVSKTILFFREREAQEAEFSKTVKHNLPQLGDHFNSVNHPEVMSSFSQGLKYNDDFHAKNTQNAAILAAFIKKDILDWTLFPSEKNYKASSSALSTPLYGYRRELDRLASDRHRAYNKYSKLYDTIQKNGNPTPKENGLFKRQLKYSLAAREELRVLRLYNEQGLNVINEYAKLSLIRLENIQKAFTLYIAKYNELNRDMINTPTPVLELIERSNSPQAINTLFMPSSLIDPPVYSFLQQRLGLGEISYNDLNAFLVNFPESQDPARSSFVLREWEAIQQGSFLKSERAVNVIATTNNNLLIVEKKFEDQETGKIQNPMQLRYTRVEDVQAGETGTVLRLVERTRGTVFNHKHSSKLMFPSAEQAQEFLSFVNNSQPSDV